MNWKTARWKPKISQLQVLKHSNRREKKKKDIKQQYIAVIVHFSWEAFRQQIFFTNKDRHLQYTNFSPAVLSSVIGDESTCATCLNIFVNLPSRIANFCCFYFVLMYSHFLRKAIYSA